MNMIELIAEAAKSSRRSELGEAYSARHGVNAQPNLTVTEDQVAAALADRLAPRIRGKTVIDIGGAFGLLALHLSTFASRVFVVEANPVYSAAYIELLHSEKPRNLTFLFGDAREFIGLLKVDVAVVCTHSDVGGMMSVARQIADMAIDVHGEMIAANPAGFDEWARNARSAAR